MLVLKRFRGEIIKIGDDIEIVVVAPAGPVKIGITAPPDVPIHREEVYDAIQRNGGVDKKKRNPQ